MIAGSVVWVQAQRFTLWRNSAITKSKEDSVWMWIRSYEVKEWGNSEYLLWLTKQEPVNEGFIQQSNPLQLSLKRE